MYIIGFKNLASAYRRNQPETAYIKTNLNGYVYNIKMKSTEVQTLGGIWRMVY